MVHQMANSQNHIELLHKNGNTVNAKLHVQCHQHINQPATNSSYLLDPRLIFQMWIWIAQEIPA